MTLRLPLPATGSEPEFADLIASARLGTADATDVARLAVHLADSGERLAWPSAKVGDVVSTGGPGSLSTLLAPIVLVAHGYLVVKLGVPGRPAGAIDVLATIPGYKSQLDSSEIKLSLSRCGFAHFLADQRFAPLDAALFAYRRRVDAVAVPLLAAASLLAKKVAVGVTTVGLDVRVGIHGNFGRNRDEARRNARLFCAAARAVGISAVAFLTDAERVAQPWIGRGESLVALATAVGLQTPQNSSGWTESHTADCYQMAAYTAASDNSDGATAAQIPQHSAREVLAAHLAAQGSSVEALLERVSAILRTPRVTLRAEHTGILKVDVGRLRKALVDAQTDGSGEFGDPAGLELLARPGSALSAGQPYAHVRLEQPGSALLSLIQSAFRIDRPESDSTDEPASEPLEVVRG